MDGFEQDEWKTVAREHEAMVEQRMTDDDWRGADAGDDDDGDDDSDDDDEAR